MIMNKRLFKIGVTILGLIIITTLQFNSFIIIVSTAISHDKNSFQTKEDVIVAVQENIKDINLLIDRIRNIANKKSFVIIENVKKTYNNSIIVKEKDINDIFKKLKLTDISVRNNDDKEICFNVKYNSYSNVCGFYYSQNDNPMYDGRNRSVEYPCIQYSNWTLMFGQRYGWYTEKIFDNWYYFEQYDGARSVIKYIEDDLKKIGYYDRVVKEIEKYEQTSNNLKY